jgi:hypothetical protein
MVDCSQSTVEIEFQNPGKSRLRPIVADLAYGSDKYDFLTCKFNTDTANKVKDNIDSLDKTRAAKVKINGKTIRTMYFSPENLELGKDHRDSDFGGYLELLDLHAFLDKGTIDKDLSNLNLRDLYSTIFRYRQEDNDPFTSPKPIFNIDREDSQNLNYVAEDEGGRPMTLTSGLNLDLEEKSTPLDALKTANNKLGIGTHITPDGELVVGSYNGTGSYIADEENSIDYIIESSGISMAYKDKLKRLNAIGPIEGIATGDASRVLGSFGSSLNSLDDPERSGQELRVVVEDDSVETGEITTQYMRQTAPDDFAKAAVRKFLQIDAAKQTGSITLNITASNSNNILKIGDLLTVDEPTSCNLLEEPAYRADSYAVQSVRHLFDKSWKTEVELAGIPDRSAGDLEFRIGYLDNATGEIYTFKDVRGYLPKDMAASWTGSITEDDVDE